MPSPSKTSLKEELTRLLTADLETRERAHRSALEAATHEEAKPENDKDTRALEQSYLARGEAARVEELRSAIAAVQAMAARPFEASDAVTMGALVTAEQDGTPSLLWVAPSGGGLRLAGGAVQVITPRSPIGRALMGRLRGDDCEVELAGRSRTMTITEVR